MSIVAFIFTVCFLALGLGVAIYAIAKTAKDHFEK